MISLVYNISYIVLRAKLCLPTKRRRTFVVLCMLQKYGRSPCDSQAQGGRRRKEEKIVWETTNLKEFVTVVTEGIEGIQVSRCL
jgi:hypothetical protein